MSNLVVVGMADLNIAKAPDRLITYGLGSCVGVALFDSVTNTAGLAHVMLPDSKNYNGEINRAKFMDTAIEDLIANMVRQGAIRYKLVARVAGGARMFGLAPENDVMKVGLRNSERAIEILGKLAIPVIAQELGGTYGRTITLFADDGRLHIKTVGHGEKTI